MQVYSCEGMRFYRDRLIHWFGYQHYTDPTKPALFLGVYFDQDLRVFAAHTGKRYVFWNGYDVTFLGKHPEYWHEFQIRTEHGTHRLELASELHGYMHETRPPIEISPTLFAPPKQYRQVKFRYQTPLRYYMNSHIGRETEYGIPWAVEVFRDLQNHELHVFGDGNQPRSGAPHNVVFHGHVSEDEMDRRTAGMHGALRLNSHDGTSQIVLKSILMGQHPIVIAGQPADLRAALEVNAKKTKAGDRRVPGLNTFILRVRKET